ncbi:MAG: hypothetical protein ACRDE5_05325, partial [Ginsengibacter sp.]
MLKIKNTFRGILFLTSVFISCGRQPCYRADSLIALVSFTDTESDTVIFRRFVKATNFANLKDTFLLSNPNGNFQRRN